MTSYMDSCVVCSSVEHGVGLKKLNEKVSSNEKEVKDIW